MKLTTPVLESPSATANHRSTGGTLFNNLTKKMGWLLAIALVVVAFILLTPFTAPNGKGKQPIQTELTPAEISVLEKRQALLEKDIQKLEGKLDAHTPKSPYLVVNTSENSFRLYKNQQLIREGKCSTGSYILLQKGDEQKWMFKTPKGEFRIQGKTVAPIWKKPDWAFVEDGLPIPSANHPSRYVYGVLGDYSLSLGQGYLLHGTLYKRLLGMPVTHGCIRLNDDDLEAIYKSLSIGSKVYIF